MKQLQELTARLQDFVISSKRDAYGKMTTPGVSIEGAQVWCGQIDAAQAAAVKIQALAATAKEIALGGSQKESLLNGALEFARTEYKKECSKANNLVRANKDPAEFYRTQGRAWFWRSIASVMEKVPDDAKPGKEPGAPY